MKIIKPLNKPWLLSQDKRKGFVRPEKNLSRLNSCLKRGDFSRGSKAQSAIEFMIITGAMLLFFVSMLLVFQQNLSLKAKEKRQFEVQEIVLKVQNEINLAAASTDGYYRNFTIPEKIINVDYSISTDEGAVYIITDDGKHAMALPIPSVAGNGIRKGSNIIQKQNSIIYLN